MQHTIEDNKTFNSETEKKLAIVLKVGSGGRDGDPTRGPSIGFRESPARCFTEIVHYIQTYQTFIH